MDILLNQSRGRLHSSVNNSMHDLTLLYNHNVDKLKDGNMSKSFLSGVYWLCIPELEHLIKKSDKQKVLEKYKWFDQLTFKPSKQGSIGFPGPSISTWYMHSEKTDLVGLPKYLGISLFGMPPRDIRKEGQLIQNSDAASTTSTTTVFFKGTLKEHQKECTKLCLDQMQSYFGATLIADCGVGKTAMAIYILAQVGRKTAIVCNRSLLIDQWHDSIRKFLGNCVTISKLEGTTAFDKKCKSADGNIIYEAPDSEADIMLCSIQTLATNNVPRALLEPYGLLIVDEMHHLAAASLVHVVPQFKCMWTLGLTATPKRSDGLEYVLYWLMGPVACVYQRVPELGIVSELRIRKIMFNDGNKKEIYNRDGTLQYTSMITLLTHDVERNKLLCEILKSCIENRKRTIAVTALVSHVQYLADYCKGLTTTAIMAGNTREDGRSCKMTIATYSMLEEGYDDPTLDTLVLCTPRSNIQQTIGRIEREHADKDHPLVYDIVDNFSLFPNMYWKRQSFYKQRGFKFM